MAIGSLIPLIAATTSGAGRKAIIQRFTWSGATSAARAIPFSGNNAAEARIFDTMRKQGIISEAGPGRFHLNQDELVAFYKKQTRLVRTIVAAGAVGLLAAFVTIR